MSGIIGSKLNHRGSGPVAKLGTDGQHLLSSGAGKSANYETVAAAAYDDDKLQSNIALLGFKTAVNGSLAKYNLQDQTIDEFTDATGIDAGASTNEALSGGGYIGGTASNPTGATSTDTSVAGYRIEVLSAASGSLVIPSSGNVDILVVGGGASGGGGNYAGGGGAGGLIYKSSHALTAQTYAWVTGAGGAGITANSTNGNNGVDSTWTDASPSVEFTAKGGGGGGAGGNDDGLAGGSAGGGSHSSTGGSANQTGQSGDSGTYGFGYDGGLGGGGPNYNPGGGGGAGSVGVAGDASTSGNGGTGKDYSAIFGTAVGDSGWFASGGGGGLTGEGTSVAGTASSGGGTAGGATDTNSAAATANTGGGSGGGGATYADSGNGGSGIILVRYADGTFVSAGDDLTLQSTDTTASTANPDYADMVMLMENAEGTATLNTDIKGYISEDSGSTFTQGTLVDEGSWGANKKIIAFHDLDISAQSGSSMCYKITTHNQSAGSKETKIHAVSIGWKA
jgi:hypothetical protein